MKKTSKLTKQGRGRPAKKITKTATHGEIVKKTGIPAFMEPTAYDLYDELARLDSYVYRQ